MEAIEELAQLSESMRQTSALLADEDVEESRRTSTFLNVVGLGNIVCFFFRSFYLFIYFYMIIHFPPSQTHALLLFVTVVDPIQSTIIVTDGGSFCIPAGCWKICCLE
jgi:hypothetical protein